MQRAYLAVMLGGAAGSALRYWLAHLCTAKFGDTFPLGTLVVNILGSLAIGALEALSGPGGLWVAPAWFRPLLMVGVLGGFTTFSAFSLQTLALLQQGETLRAGANILLSVVLCLAGVWIGYAAVQALAQR